MIDPLSDGMIGVTITREAAETTKGETTTGMTERMIVEETVGTTIAEMRGETTTAGMIAEMTGEIGTMEGETGMNEEAEVAATTGDVREAVAAVAVHQGD